VGSRYELDLGHMQDQSTRTVAADGIVLATGYTERALDQLLGPLNERSVRDAAGRLLVDADYRVQLDPAITGTLFVQNAEKHTHGVGTPDLGLGAWRAATILNSICAREVFRLPKRTAFTRFGLARSALAESALAESSLARSSCEQANYDQEGEAGA
jgi:lysine N6-hydroxylase